MTNNDKDEQIKFLQASVKALADSNDGLKKQLSGADDMNDTQYDYLIWYQEKMEEIKQHVLNPSVYSIPILNYEPEAVKSYIQRNDKWYAKLRDLLVIEEDE